MNKNNEMVAIKGSGLSMAYLLKPAMLIGLFLTLMQFGLSEIMVPITVPKATKIWIEDVKKKKIVTTREKKHMDQR